MYFVFHPWVEEREGFVEEMTWVKLENPLVQILVVVVITMLRTHWTEVENGFGWRAIRSEWVDPKRFVKHDKKWDGLNLLKAIIELKGKKVKIPLLGEFFSFFRGGGLVLFSGERESSIFGIFKLRWRKRTLRLGRKEGAEISSLFKRKKGKMEFRKRVGRRRW